MKAMIMAAGVGSRLMPLTRAIPKPLIPVANYALLENTVKLLYEHDCRQLICNLHHHASLISGCLRNGEQYGVQLRYSLEPELLGTAGGVKNCEAFLDETFIVISGDALTDINLSWLLKQHRAKSALATIALKEVEQVENYGVVLIDQEGRILDFQEKPRPQEAISRTANTGIYIFEPEIFEYIPGRRFYDFGKQLFPDLVKMGAPFFGAVIEDYWCDVGNLLSYRQANEDVLRGRVRAEKRGTIIRSEDGGQVLLGDGVELGSDIRFLGNVVIGRQCRVEDKAQVSDSVIWADSVIEKGAVLREAIIGSNCTVGARSLLGAGSVVASNCVLEPGSDLAPGAKIFDTPAGNVGGEPW